MRRWDVRLFLRRWLRNNIRHYPDYSRLSVMTPFCQRDLF